MVKKGQKLVNLVCIKYKYKVSNTVVFRGAKSEKQFSFIRDKSSYSQVPKTISLEYINEASLIKKVPPPLSRLFNKVNSASGGGLFY